MHRLLILVALALVALQLACAHARARPFDPNAVTRRYVAVRNGEVIGKQLIADVDPKTLRVRWSYRIDGRGPKLDAGFALGSRSHPVWVETTGHDAMGRPVAERFVQTRREANWSNRGEKGRRRTRGQHFYLSFDPVPEELAMLVRALAVAPKRSLPLLPAGRATLHERGTWELSRDGTRINALRYGIVGLDHVPLDIWFDERDTLLAIIRDDYTLIRDHWAHVRQRLEQMRRVDERERQRRWARELRYEPAATLALTNADIFDPHSLSLRPKQTLLITGSRISAVGPTAELRVPDNAHRIDAQRAVIVPGLWDMRGRGSPIDGLLHLAAGVTSIRAFSRPNERAPLWTEESHLIGPRVHGRVHHPLADYDACASTSPNPKPSDAWLATDLLHVGLAWPSDGDPPETDALLCLLTGVHAWRLADMQMDSIAAHFADLHITVELPLARVETDLRDRPRSTSRAHTRISNRLPIMPRRQLDGGGLVGRYDDSVTARRELATAYDTLLEYVGSLHDSGVAFVPSSAGLPGFGLHRTLEQLVAAGLSPAEALFTATLGAARHAGRDADLGTIAPGKLADFALTRSDPTEEISNLRAIELVSVGGRMYRSTELYAVVGVTE